MNTKNKKVSLSVQYCFGIVLYTPADHPARHTVVILCQGSRDQTDSSVFRRNANTSNPVAWWENNISREKRKKNAMGFIVYFCNRLGSITWVRSE